MSAQPSRFSLEAICLSGFRAVQESRTVKAPGMLSDERDEPCNIILLSQVVNCLRRRFLSGSQDMLDLGALHTF